MTTAIVGSLAIFASFSTVCTLSYDSHYGTAFDIGMVPTHYSDEEIILDIASNANGQLKLYVPFLNISRTETLNNGRTTITVAKKLIRRENFTERRGIHIQSDVPVAVYVTQYRSSMTESYLALPVTFAGKKYVLASFKPDSAPAVYSEALVVSSFTNTVVNITTTRLSTSSVSLNWLDANQILQKIDNTGTAVSANSTVSVIAGTSCANVPQNHTSHCGLIVEQMIPTDAWGMEYIVPNMPPLTGVLIRVLSQKHHDVCFDTQHGTTCKQVPYPYPLEFFTGSEPVVVRSNTTISVISYGIGNGPFMTVVPGIENFMNEYYFIAPASYTYYRNSIGIVIQSSQTTGLILDGSSISSKFVFNVPQPYDSYNVLIIDISAGYHKLSHQNVNVKFGAILYGQGSDAGEGYGFPLGMQKETAKITVEKNICYHCNGTELCHVVKRCSENEICYLERFLENGRKTFRSGCLSQEVCLKESETAGNDPDRCVHCCPGSYCNHKGCGETGKVTCNLFWYCFRTIRRINQILSGLPTRDQRGPLCSDCGYAFSSDECDTLKLCDQGQVCSIEETRWGTHSIFKMGCTHAPCSPVQHSEQVLQRPTPTCLACCSKDSCNLNCNGHGQPAIVG